MLKSAAISMCGKYRWKLERIWDQSKPILVVCMLNPSTADADINDPTVLRLIKFATLWGFGGIWVVNQYAYRSSSPAVLARLNDEEAEGPANYIAWNEALTYAAKNTGWILVAWGNGGQNRGRFNFWVEHHELEMRCLGVTQNGSPKHPLARGKHRILDNQMSLSWYAPCE